MKISATDTEIDISDDLLGHNITERMISDFLTHENEDELALEGEKDFDPKPYDRSLRGLKIKKTKGPTLLEEKEGYLMVSGSVENLEAFCSYFTYDESSKEDDHFHYEYFEGEKTIAPESRSMVVTLKDKYSEQGASHNERKRSS